MAYRSARTTVHRRDPAGWRWNSRNRGRSTFAPDGYTLLLLNGGLPINAALYPNLNYDLVRDIAPVASFFKSAHIMLVNPWVPAETVPEFVAYAKANPGKINFGSNGVGATGHLAGEMFKVLTSVDMPLSHRVRSCCIAAGQLTSAFGGIAAAGRQTKFMLAANRGETGGVIKPGFHLGFAAEPHVVSLEVDES
jgi:hypothetical protein